MTVTGTGTVATRTATYTLTVNGPPGCSGTNPTDVTISDNTTVESPITISGCTGNARVRQHGRGPHRAHVPR